MQNEEMTEVKKDPYKTSRILYIIEAALEYFISIAVGGAYLAKVASYIGLNDSLTGILTSFVSLGCGFQIVAVFLNRKPVKPWVTLLHTLNQVFFALVYVVPFFDVSTETKAVLFVVCLLAGHILNNVVNSPKINWYMSLVDNDKRGSFTANKEIVSLLGGMLFSFGLGAVIDYFDAQGDMRTAFALCGVGIFVLAISHTLVLIFSKEKPVAESEQTSTKTMIKSLIKDKNIVKIVLVSVLWNVAHYATTPFYGTYQNKELGFSMTFVSVLSILYAVVRAIFSRPMGKFADKKSFATMITVCFAVQAAGFLVNTFTTPANGKIFYTTYYMLNAVAMAGINSGVINLIYDYVSKEQRTAALALKSAFAGFVGFFTTLAVSPLVSVIQGAGNQIFGMTVYAQQVLSAIGFVIVVGLIVYMNVVVKKIQKKKEEEKTAE